MSLLVQRSEWFIGDLEHYAAWYDREANWDVAERYLNSVAATLARLAKLPGMGRPVFFPAPELQGLRCRSVSRPFQKHLIFYRHSEAVLYAERIIHGARDLPVRLMQAPSADDRQT